MVNIFLITRKKVGWTYDYLQVNSFTRLPKQLQNNLLPTGIILT